MLLRRFGESLETSEQEWLVWEVNQKIAEAKGSAPTLQDMPPEEPPEVIGVAICALTKGSGFRQSQAAVQVVNAALTFYETNTTGLSQPTRPTPLGKLIDKHLVM